MAQPGGRGGSTATAPTDNVGPWRQEATDVARAASGGLLFGIPAEGELVVRVASFSQP